MWWRQLWFPLGTRNLRAAPHRHVTNLRHRARSQRWLAFKDVQAHNCSVTSHESEHAMAWAEQIGKQSRRVRYRSGDGHTASISGFTTQRAADNYAADIETDQRRNA
ncbi:hypothetical protein GCM10011609_65510 [Lentzea pudingi]|uniref:AP2/ERF domain-containing protein n=2 Tax=Lentzea pudingi TaxID=1789439 RepID=A0ABQ2IKT5_9PSEU|nr:hypothetical protein GCM10011609_65510 [Lentzea pudingi]